MTGGVKIAKLRKGGKGRRGLVACGLMSGTSRDGIDVAFVEIGDRFPQSTIRLIHAETIPYPGWLRKMLMLPPSRLTAQDVASLDFAVGKLFGLAVLKALRHAGLERDDIDVIGSHGQTLLHMPRGVRIGNQVVRSTLQVGHGAVIAEATGITTVSDFRSADIAVGGEGAPLVPIFDYAVLRSRSKSRVALNIGGIANLTAIPRDGMLRSMTSFDTGPGNCMIDTAVRLLTGGRRGYDRDGEVASRGTPDTRELERILSHPYFKRKPPKSTGWEEFGEDLTRRVVGRMKRRNLRKKVIVRTVTEVVCESIGRAIEDFVVPLMRPDEVIVTGGGSKNRFLMKRLSCRLRKISPSIVVGPGEAFGINSDAKEACAFAYLAYLCVRRIPANVVSLNAGLKPAVLGAIYPVYPGPDLQSRKLPHAGRAPVRC
jgi:anhydro-N-acetylmuramic acid kinase